MSRANKNIKWLFFINPPYAEAGTAIGREYKTGVKLSNIADEMKAKKMGRSANELKMQFLYKIERDFGKRGYYLGLFSTPKWITKPSQEEFRKIWKPKFDGGFMLNAIEHFIQQTNEKYELKAHGHFPILFSLLDRREKMKTWNQDWTYGLIDNHAKAAGAKTFLVFDEKRLAFIKYFFPNIRTDTIKPLPRMSSAVIPCNGKNIEGKAAADCLGAMKLKGIDFLNQQYAFLLSALPSSSGVVINPTNYNSILTGFALYKSVKYDWRNHEDIFYAPYRDLTDKEKADCLLYALLENKNNTATARVDGNMLYNWFNPFDKAKFNFAKCSKTGKKAFAELTDYCENRVQWRKLETPYGYGEWLGLYQYRTDYEQVNRTYKKKFGRNYPNKDLYGIVYPDSFQKAVEALRQQVEALAIDLCLSAGKTITRTQNSFIGKEKPLLEK
ncbi:MAG: hypothetical protein LBT89_12195 [Planctomycetaceae bacterium]|nr:hypothetical protein [Planctomycetaceae bacterium]